MDIASNIISSLILGGWITFIAWAFLIPNNNKTTNNENIHGIAPWIFVLLVVVWLAIGINLGRYL